MKQIWLSNRTRGLSPIEMCIIVLLIAVSLVLGITGKGRKERRHAEAFIKQAPLVQAALERFAADHGGRFPPDAMFTRQPQGLNGQYLEWKKKWRIDYEVHDNGKGGLAVCLEFLGPFSDLKYFGLCTKPEYRALYSRGQPIPGYYNRIWVIRESAQVMVKDKGPG